MAHTIRNVPSFKWNRTPRFKWKLLAGISRKNIVTNYDDKPIAARKEFKYGIR